MKILTSGLGGGLDIVNASLLYFAARHEGALRGERWEPIIGSIRPAPLDLFKEVCQFNEVGAWVVYKSEIDAEKLRTPSRAPRYAEPKVADFLNESVMYFAREFKGKPNPRKLRAALLEAREINKFEHMFFVDGGGDSLTLKVEDAADTSENFSSVFTGGDAVTLEALSGFENVYMAVVAVGLDISKEGFQKNLKMLDEMDAYLGRVNLKTGEKDNYKLDHIISFNRNSYDFIEDYFYLAEKILVLTEEDLNNPEKIMSHTAVVTYHALKGNYGIQRTFVEWEPVTDGQKGVLVTPEHCWMYFFDASEVHNLKLALNKKL